MDWTEALEIVVSQTGVERYRHLASDDNPDAWGRQRYREAMIVQASSPAAVPASFPPIQAQARSLWRSIRAFVANGGKLASKAERARRLAICRACPFFLGGRCKKCGCATQVKTFSAAETCPDIPPRWGPVTGQ